MYRKIILIVVVTSQLSRLHKRFRISKFLIYSQICGTLNSIILTLFSTNPNKKHFFLGLVNSMVQNCNISFEMCESKSNHIMDDIVNLIT